MEGDKTGPEQVRAFLEEKWGEATDVFRCDCCERNTLHWNNSNVIVVIGGQTIYFLSRAGRLIERVKILAFKEEREDLFEALDDIAAKSNIEINYEEEKKYCAICVDRGCPDDSTGDCQDPIPDSKQQE